MLAQLRPAVTIFLILSVVTGIAYPLAVTGIAQAVFPAQANGSLLTSASGTTGSRLIGQEFGTSDPASAPALAGWFWSRPSATSPVPYTALNLGKGTGSSGSNLAFSNPARAQNIEARTQALHTADASVNLARTGTAVPIDLVTSSASGLDPHISPAAAEYQIPRIARARNTPEDTLRDLVRKHTQDRTLGLLGEPVVNVLTLNLELNTIPRR